MISGHPCGTPGEQALGQGRYEGSVPPATQHVQAHETILPQQRQERGISYWGKSANRAHAPWELCPWGCTNQGKREKTHSSIAFFAGCLLTSLQRLHFTSFTCLTSKSERIAYVPLWREANPAEKRHLSLRIFLKP